MKKIEKLKIMRQLAEKDRNAVLEFTNRVKKLVRDNLVSVALFGSKITGNDTPESDIDILVLVNKLSSEEKNAILDLAFEVNLKNDVYISPRIISRDIFEHPVWKLTPFIISLKTKGVSVI